MLVIGDSLDDAGYLYHDLSRVLGESAVLMFPSGYKRSIKYGQVDPPSQIMRTEVLNHWFDDPSLRYVVTYPEALAEHVATRDTIEAHTLQLAVGSTVDLAETEKWLRENGFQEVDYVYDPAISQFAAPFSTSTATVAKSLSASTFSATKSSRYAHSTSKHSSRSQSTTASRSHPMFHSRAKASRFSTTFPPTHCCGCAMPTTPCSASRPFQLKHSATAP